MNIFDRCVSFHRLGGGVIPGPRSLWGTSRYSRGRCRYPGGRYLEWQAFGEVVIPGRMNLRV